MPQRFERSEKAEDAQNAEDSRTTGGSKRDDDVCEGDDDERSVHDVPDALQIGVFVKQHSFGNDLR